MKLARLIRISALLFMFVLPLIVAAAEVENPLYKHWASFEVGSSVTLEGLTYKWWGDGEFDFDETPRTEIWTLKEITNEYVVLGMASKSGTAGWKTESEKYYRTYDTGSGTMEDCGDEEIEVAGRKIKCRHYRIKNEGGYSMEGNFWLSPDIPGEAQRTWGGGEYEGELTAESWEKK
jgi:hypothetical protein